MKAVFILLAILAVGYAAPKNEEDAKNAGGEQEVNTTGKGEDNQTPAVPKDNNGKDNDGKDNDDKDNDDKDNEDKDNDGKDKGGNHSRRKRDTRDYTYPQNDDNDSNYHPHNKFVKKGGILGALKRVAQALLGVVGI